MTALELLKEFRKSGWPSNPLGLSNAKLDKIQVALEREMALHHEMADKLAQNMCGYCDAKMNSETEVPAMRGPIEETVNRISSDWLRIAEKQ